MLTDHDHGRNAAHTMISLLPCCDLQEWRSIGLFQRISSPKLNHLAFGGEIFEVLLHLFIVAGWGHPKHTTVTRSRSKVDQKSPPRLPRPLLRVNEPDVERKAPRRAASTPGLAQRIATAATTIDDIGGI